MKTELSDVLGKGDPGKVQTLITAGADIRYKSEHGYDALLDAVHGRDIALDPQLLELLSLLIAHGVDLSGTSTYGESALRVLSRIGRFDAAQLLLKAGADRDQLKWTPLMEAVALGSLQDVEAHLNQGALLEDRDYWERTAWLIACLTGDIGKAKLLRERGAVPTARGRCGQPPLFYAIQGHHPEMLQWLLQEGEDVQQTDDFGSTPLLEAVEHNDRECVDILLTAGADVNAYCSYGTVLSAASSREIIMRLLAEGANPADADQQIILGLKKENDAFAGVTQDEFQRTSFRRFGTQNPERMFFPFWEAMIRSGDTAYAARQRFGEESNSIDSPIWCAERFGQSLTILPDGRVIQIGGEHEDSYDPDFCIYNDVIVHDGNGSVAIYGYLESAFPPTDFHTATLIGDAIYIIGNAGYHGTRHFGETQLYRLDIHTFRMDRLIATGTAPGWIYKHRAAAVGQHIIRVWGGEIISLNEGAECHESNQNAFVLDLERLIWSRE